MKLPVGRRLVPEHTRCPRAVCENPSASSHASTTDATKNTPVLTGKGVKA